MTSFEEHLEQILETTRRQDLFRRLREVQSASDVTLTLHSETITSFASNDYLGLANHPQLKAAARDATDRFGAGSGASRLITGSLTPHRDLENRLASFKGTQAALVFNSGYQTAVGVLSAVLTEHDVVFSDRLNHACLIDGIRLSKAKTKVFNHNDAKHLESLLKETSEQQHSGEIEKGNWLIVTESVFSMDGDQAPLNQIAQLKQEFGAWLMIDEAHATGFFGKNRSGLVEASGLSDQVDIHMGTLGKALGSAGGFVCGSQALREVLINRARSFIFSTAPTPASAAAATAALSLVESAEGERRAKDLWERVKQLREGLNLSGEIHSPIIPYIVGDEAQSLALSQKLLEQRILVPAIRYPSVPRGEARLRITLSANHTEEQVNQLVSALNSQAQTA